MARMAHRVSAFGTTIFSEINDLAAQHEAINLGQGKPDFDGETSIIQTAVEALQDGKYNQYAPGTGIAPLREAIAHHEDRYYNLNVNPDTEILVTVGATEAIFASIMGLIDPGDEVIVFEPFYDSYVPAILMAGGIPRYCPLHPPKWVFDPDELRALFNEKTRAIIINTPHNPTGKIYTPDELATIVTLCHEFDAIVISDEVYEHLLFDDYQHHSMIMQPDMFDRTIKISSFGKTYSLTGWKIGWIIGAAPHITGSQRARQFMTFAVAHPLQVGAATAFKLPESYFQNFRQFFQARRDQLLSALQTAGFKTTQPEGGYFIMADFSKLYQGDDIEFARWLTSEIGVACIPPSFFYSADHKNMVSHFARFAFCKSEAVLEAAAEKLKKL